MPILHIVDESIRFFAARFLPDVSTKVIWDTLLRFWAPIYTGLLNWILVDQGSYLANSESFVSLAARANVEVQCTGREAHSSLAIGERCHEPVRTTLRKMILVYPNVYKAPLLQMAIKATREHRCTPELIYDLSARPLALRGHLALF